MFRLTSKGFEGIHPFTEPIPTTNAYEVLVKVRSIGLNYRDVAIVNDKYPLAVKDNLVLCSDLAGEVVQVGSLVDGFAAGDAATVAIDPTYLYAPFKKHTGTWGGYQDGMLREYMTIPAHAAIKLPSSSLSFAQWATLPSCASTVWNAFYGNQPLKPGDTVLLLGTRIPFHRP